MEEVENRKFGREGGIILIQGGGNSLSVECADRVWRRIEVGVEHLLENNINMRIGVMGVTIRPSENKSFECQRLILNSMIQRGAEEINKKYRPGEGRVTYVNTEFAIGVWDIGKNGVHFNRLGYTKMNKLIERFVIEMEEARELKSRAKIGKAYVELVECMKEYKKCMNEEEPDMERETRNENESKVQETMESEFQVHESRPNTEAEDILENGGNPLADMEVEPTQQGEEIPKN